MSAQKHHPASSKKSRTRTTRVMRHKDNSGGKIKKGKKRPQRRTGVVEPTGFVRGARVKT